MRAIGRHLSVDMYGCNFDNLDNFELIKTAILAAIEEANMTLLNLSYHKFEPQGLTVLALLNHCHISIHTYPELGYAAVDIFSCGDYSRPDRALLVLKKVLKPEKTKTTNFVRGDFGSQKDMKPRIRISIAPLRRVRNTSAKVWSYLRKK
ncbi:MULTISPECIES: adenosylmethionine decarboxylase [Sporomusa]|uniref:S-adenosylmethionine decarboxylase proenzyme n=2 Tax=Sporomusa TaxID=2375 RepID=A0ABM9W981_9FIRM|nr:MULTISPECIES: adenosylmethionine decarboxylase [Sporomusa]MCM0757081.1 adenosylmethionine decarboxylase [Sporomusa sphaeroides DSM 2875]OLS56876.1 S-adenosylmethionine decarboxylase proenzyme precursor [Sporomusa sphaeroides DSM 2875]CVK21708.1 S-adenosylmethionine decarboxylase proenzyme precursor [Sporomusa sphaeroides DSM 2875]SCM81854.1 S-adenosylmethionine decarboxylase proenzyme [uncultured Sporomusa sp.]HML32162.1 adenosylmethionine decarboxylase [Sporomusa sphaeroides]